MKVTVRALVKGGKGHSCPLPWPSFRRRETTDPPRRELGLPTALVRFTGCVKTLSDGTFTFQGPGMRGVAHHMGRAAVLYAGEIHLVVMERAVSHWEAQLYRSVGEEPTADRDLGLAALAAPTAPYLPPRPRHSYRPVPSSDRRSPGTGP